MRRRSQQQCGPTGSAGKEISSKPETMRVELLGGFRVWVGSRVIEEDEWRLRKAKSLVKLLALSPGHRLHREQLMEALWPGLEPHAAANNLHYALYVARRALQPSALASTSTTAASSYLLLREEQLVLCPDGPLWVDVEAFEAAAADARHAPAEPAAFRAAIDLYAGELLPQDRYEPWVEERRAQLRGLYLSLVLELGALYEKREEYESAIEALGRAVAHEPAHEEAHAGLMRLYALSGRRREALRQYERLREALVWEFGREPEVEARRLQQEIWAGIYPHSSDPAPAGFPLEEATSATGPAGAPRRHNLPLARTSFVGREGERLEVKRLLAMTRLLTLTGAGGCGKTRLALEVASDLVGAYPDGVWLVEFAPLSDPKSVPQVVASTLEVREQPGRPLLETLKDTLRSRKTLVVMDNCEHLVEAVAGLVDSLLDSCPDLRILATSRERLNTAGEVNRVVPSLTVPDPRHSFTPQEMGAYESVRLFVERARQRDPFFVLSTGNGQAVAQICGRLEGIPLAVELAAARVGVLSAEQLASRLDNSLKLLTGGIRTAEPRQRSLRATLEWSHELLNEPGRVLLRRLSVFAGGWTLEAAEEVCSGDGIEREGILEVLSELVERSLVVTKISSRAAGGTLRYRILEPIRQYGQERLQESGTNERLRERHARYFLALAEGEDTQEFEPELRRVRPVVWLEQMEDEHANLRAALSWSLDNGAEEPEAGVEPNGGRKELGLRLAAELWWLWHTHDYLSEGRMYLERAYSASSTPTTARVRARALNGAGGIAISQGDWGAAKVFIEEGLDLYRQLGDDEGIASTLTDLCLVAVMGQQDDIPVAVIMEELRDLRPRLENRSTLAYLLLLEGVIGVSQSDLERSVALHEEALELFREIGDTPGIITCLGQLGGIVMVQGDYEAAVPLLRETLRLAWESDYKVAIQFTFYILACMAAPQERLVRAARLWGAVEGMEEGYGVYISPIALSACDYEGRLSIARSQLDESAWSGAWAQGKAMALEQAVEYAFSEEEEDKPSALIAVPEQQQPPPADEPTERLTIREQEIALLVARGLTNRQIAQELSISERTVENHIGKILRKQGFSSRARIAAWVAQR